VDRRVEVRAQTRSEPPRIRGAHRAIIFVARIRAQLEVVVLLETAVLKPDAGLDRWPPQLSLGADLGGNHPSQMQVGIYDGLGEQREVETFKLQLGADALPPERACGPNGLAPRAQLERSRGQVAVGEVNSCRLLQRPLRLWVLKLEGAEEKTLV